MSAPNVQLSREDVAALTDAQPTLAITVLIPSWKRPESLGRCLDALEAQQRQPDEVVLSVRADDEATRSMLAGRSLPFAHPIATPAAPGLLAALNAGYDLAVGDVVVATDDDTVAHPDWLARIERHFATEPGLGALGGPDRMVLQDHPPDGIEDVVVGKVQWYGRILGNHHLGAGEAREVDIVKGANFAIRKAALGARRIDSTLRGTGAEHNTELDLCLGLKRDGWKLVYDPAVIVDHHEEVRHGGERENRMTDAEHHDAIHNQTYALLKHLPPLCKLTALAYGLLVGTRDSPGLALAIERHFPGGRSSSSAASLRIATAARIDAVRSWVRHGRSGV